MTELGLLAYYVVFPIKDEIKNKYKEKSFDFNQCLNLNNCSKVNTPSNRE